MTPNIFWTIEEVPGLEKLGAHDPGLPPMTDIFYTNESTWTFSAFPALLLFNTQLPLLDKGMKVSLGAIPKPTHEAACWVARTKGFDFNPEGRAPTEAFNHVIWEGLMGDRPYPMSARELTCARTASSF